MEVTVVGTVGNLYSEVFSLDTSTLPNPGDLIPMQFQFNADGAAATIRFRSLVNSTFDGPFLDNVVVTAVPEARAWLVIGIVGIGVAAATYTRRHFGRSAVAQ
jgi:hypothetical protein